MSGKPSVEMFTDGACSGNPGPGGWGVILRARGTEKELSGGDRATTNNRMEMMAAIQGLAALKAPSAVTLYTDSRYVLDGATKWLLNWKRNGWKTADKKPVKNDDLWRLLEVEMARHDISWQWVRGTTGIRRTNARIDWREALSLKCSGNCGGRPRSGSRGRHARH